MAQIVIQNLFEKIIKVTGQSQTLLAGFQANGIDWMHACGGKGRCTTCKVIVLSGEYNLAALTESEKKYQMQGLLADHERLACQAKVLGDISVSVPEDYKLPHVKYSD